MGRIILEGAYLNKARREKDFLCKTAEEPYAEMFHTHKAYLSNIPVNKKYLGIHPESLSRIRTSEPDTLQHVHMIRSRIHRLDDFIKNILNYSRNNRTGLEIQMVPVENTILETVSSLADIKQAKNIEFKISCEEEAPFYSDLLSFKTVVENIISNAIKFAAKNRAKPYIRIKAKTDSRKLSLVIEDNGIGIPSKHLEKIFDMFFRASADTEGSGIGLYIVREIVEKLGGTIAVQSEENKKTTFILTLKNFKP